MAKRILTRPEERTLQVVLRNEYLTGWRSTHDAALRHGVPDTVVAKLLRRVRIELEEDVREQRKNEIARTLQQLEQTIGKALEAYELSRKRRFRCKSCKGLGEDKDGSDCGECNGEGWSETTVPGDPKHLNVVLKALEQKEKIFGMEPPKQTGTNNQQFNLFGGGGQQGDQGRQNPLLGATVEQLLIAKRLMLELRSVGEEERNVVDVEFSDDEKSK